MSVNSEMTGLGDEIRKLSGLSKLLSIPEMREALHNVKLGITPTGDIEINENGTFDITNYANAIVNVEDGGRSDNLKKWDVNVASTTTSGSVTLLADPWLDEHKNDGNLLLVWFPIEALQYSRYYSHVGGFKLGRAIGKSGSNMLYGGHVRLNYSGYSSGYSTYSMTNSSSASGNMYIASGGVLKWNANSSYPIEAGDYTIIAVLT